MILAINPLISIVIPHFNRVELLQETLKYIKAQEYKNWEVVVVDDGSTAEQWLALQHLATEQIRVLKRVGGQQGPSRCRNLGVADSLGDLIVFVDSDDLLAPWCLAQRVKEIAKNPEFDCWIFQVMLFRQQPGDLATCWNRLEGNDDLERFLHSDPPWHTSSPVWKKQTFLDIGGFNEKVMYGDDSDLHVRTLLLEKKIEKCLNLFPDVFVRRGEMSRITNRLDQAMIDSRQVRLCEGTQVLKNLNVSGKLMQIWEGQYFVEAEFLLFNAGACRAEISKVLLIWVEHFSPSFLRRSFVYSYFWIAQATKNHLYIFLRIARRIMKVLLPNEFFPMCGSFQSHDCDPKELQIIRKRLYVTGLSGHLD